MVRTGLFRSISTATPTIILREYLVQVQCAHPVFFFFFEIMRVPTTFDKLSALCFVTGPVVA